MAMLREAGVPDDAIEMAGYHRLAVKDDGFCILFREGGCTVHPVKPETCVAGPFTFDIHDDLLEIYLKKESICPMVPHLVKDAPAYKEQFDRAVEMIMALVRELPAEELAVVLQVEEPDTIKVAEISLFKDGEV